jgi:hypothetical protein
VSSSTVVGGLLADLRSRPTSVARGAGGGIVVGCINGDIWRVDIGSGKVALVGSSGGEPVSVLSGDPLTVGLVSEGRTRLLQDGREVSIDRDDVCAIESIEGRPGALCVVCAGGDVLVADMRVGRWAHVGRRRPAVVVTPSCVTVDAGAAGRLDLNGERLRTLAHKRDVRGRVVAMTSGPAGVFLHSTGGSLVRLAPADAGADMRVTVVADPDASLGRRSGVSGWSGGVAAGAGVLARVHAGEQSFEWAAESAWYRSAVALCCGDSAVTWEGAGIAGSRLALGSPATGIVRIGEGFGTVHADGTVRTLSTGAPTVLAYTRRPLLGTLSCDGWTVGVSLGGEVVHLGRRAA